MSKHKTNKHRTYARNRPVVSRRGVENIWESDGVYIFKLIVVTLSALVWLRFQQPIIIGDVISIGAFPVGFAVSGLLIALLEKAQFNRKVLYAVLVVVTIIGFFLDAGIIV